MAWIPPKTTWTVQDAITVDDLNRIEGNTLDNRDTMTAHINNAGAHLKAGERESWNAKVNIRAAYMTNGVEIDPNTTIEGRILTNHPNGPTSGAYWYIDTLFYNGISTSANRAQFAVKYNNLALVAVRNYYNGTWSSWRIFGSQTTISSTAPANPQSGDLWVQI